MSPVQPSPVFQSTTTVNFQSSISAVTTEANEPMISPHHPITCNSKIFLNEDNSFGCEHVTVAPDNKRTQRCITHSIAALIIELAVEKL